MGALFDYRTLADRLKVPPDRLCDLEMLVRGQYAGDEMLVELRMLRTLRAIEDGAITLAEAIAEFRNDPVGPMARTA